MQEKNPIEKLKVCLLHGKRKGIFLFVNSNPESLVLHQLWIIPLKGRLTLLPVQLVRKRGEFISKCLPCGSLSPGSFFICFGGLGAVRYFTGELSGLDSKRNWKL